MILLYNIRNYVNQINNIKLKSILSSLLRQLNITNKTVSITKKKTFKVFDIAFYI